MHKNRWIENLSMRLNPKNWVSSMLLCRAVVELQWGYWWAGTAFFCCVWITHRLQLCVFVWIFLGGEHFILCLCHKQLVLVVLHRWLWKQCAVSIVHFILYRFFLCICVNMLCCTSFVNRALIVSHISVVIVKVAPTFLDLWLCSAEKPSVALQCFLLQYIRFSY